MSRVAIEINDAALVVADQSGVIVSEPGIAVVEDGQVLTGAKAWARARLMPSLVSTGHWMQLDGGSEAPGLKLTRAELVLAQMAALWRQVEADSVLLVVPGFFSAEQLGVMLGLAQEIRMPVELLVDSAVAASECNYPGAELYLLDAGLEHISLTHIEQGDVATLGVRQIVDSAGLLTAMDTLAKSVAAAFVLNTRFDPLHDASSDQAVFDALPQWLGELAGSDRVAASIDYKGETFSAELEAERLRQAARPFNRALLQLVAHHRKAHRPAVIQVAHTLQRIPGLLDELSRLDDARIVALEAGSAARSVLARTRPADSAGDAVRLVKRLAFAREAAAAVPMAATEPVGTRTEATHVVYGGTAYRIDRGAISVGTAPTGERQIIVAGNQPGIAGEHCTVMLSNGELLLRSSGNGGTFLNERRVSAESAVSLAPGDTVRLGTPGVEMHVIAVEP